MDTLTGLGRKYCLLQRLLNSTQLFLSWDLWSKRTPRSFWLKSKTDVAVILLAKCKQIYQNLTLEKRLSKNCDESHMESKLLFSEIIIQDCDEFHNVVRILILIYAPIHENCRFLNIHLKKECRIRNSICNEVVKWEISMYVLK